MCVYMMFLVFLYHEFLTLLHFFTFSYNILFVLLFLLQVSYNHSSVVHSNLKNHNLFFKKIKCKLNICNVASVRYNYL